MDALRALLDAVVVAVVRESTEARALAISEALLEGGVDALEVTAGTPNAFGIVATLARSGTRATLGAGTIQTEDELRRAVDAGARFLVSPHVDPALIAATKAAGVVSIPGALTPTEVVTAYRAGGDVVKLFPISAVGGSRYVRLIRAPLPNIPLWVSGSVTLEEVEEYVEAGAALLGLTTALTGGLQRASAEELRAVVRTRVEAARASVLRAGRRRTLLSIAGPGGTLTVGRDDLEALPSSEHLALETVVSGRRGEAVRLRSLLARAGIPATPGLEVQLESSDGFSRSAPADALHRGAYLHHASGGQALEKADGGPLRLYVVDSASPCDNVKDLVRVRSGLIG